MCRLGVYGIGLCTFSLQSYKVVIFDLRGKEAGTMWCIWPFNLMHVDSVLRAGPQGRYFPFGLAFRSINV